MADLSDAEFEAANEQGRIEFETKPHAASASFERSSGLMTLKLYNGCSFTFAPRDVQGLDAATDNQIEAFELSFTGYGLHWDDLDVDITVPGLLAGSFGTARFMQLRRARLGDVYRRLVAQSEAGWDAAAAE
jgi:hypothetical protein